MTFKEIMALRKSGNQEDAYEQALNSYQEQPTDPWLKKALAWCIYDALKANSSFANKEVFFQKMIEIKDLEFPETETMFWPNVAWCINTFLWDCAKQRQVPEDVLLLFCDVVKDLPIAKPSQEHSALMNVALRFKESWKVYYGLCEWLGLDGFQQEDYHKITIEGQTEMKMSLAERSSIAYSKALINAYKCGVASEEKVLSFAERLTKLNVSYPEYQFALFYQAKLLLTIGRKEDSIQVLLPFVPKKSRDFWVWEQLGDAYDDDEMRFSCYCKALLCPSQAEMLVNLREKFADLLINRQQYDLAKTEINKAIEARQKKDWRLTAYLTKAAQSDWFKSATASDSNKVFYQNNCAKAEELLYAQYPEMPVLITYVNADKHMVSFVTANRKEGFFNYSRILKYAPKEDSVLLCRFQKVETGKPSNALTCMVDKDHSKYEGIFFKTFEGSLKLSERGFGFVGDVFIPAASLRDKQNGDLISGVAVLRFDRKKGTWGWRIL